jgi:Tol biopolymer transport system component/tRNA A-37 threonylcarbamoyl transferase component Bud32
MSRRYTGAPVDGTLPSQLGPYRILDRLGAGGMGTVYRARDDRLGRDVAIKVLLDGHFSRKDNQARLLWEARAASALNHPNIVAVYDVGTDGGVSYIVSELVTGEPLRRELDRGPLEIRRLLSIATQIADGMAAAHAAGITHGDLKPENVLVARDGRAKIVDFGLATSSATSSASDGSPATADDTLPGLIVGTAAYASPERAQGRAVDARSDQFSFGVMLFEMATGAQPFKRGSPVETLSAVIQDDVPEAAARNEKVPQSLQWILDRCLAKAPEDRYASTSDLVLDLRAVRDRLLKQPGGGGRTRPRLRRDLAAAVAAGVAIGVLGLTAWLFETAPPPEAAVSAGSYTPLAADPGFQGQPAWSTDGTTIAYVAEVDGVLQVFTRGVTASERSQVTFEKFDCDNPFWSPDGRYIYYHTPRGDKIALYRIAPVNGTPEMVLENATRSALSPDGKLLAFVKDLSDQAGAMSLWFASPVTAQIQERATFKYEAPPFGQIRFADVAPRFSPDGKQLLLLFEVWFTERRGTLPSAGFIAISLDDWRAHRVLESLGGDLRPNGFSWMPDSRHIVTTLRIGGPPTAHLWMADAKADHGWPITMSSESEGYPASSKDGRIAYAQEETNFDLVRLALDGSGMQPLLSTSRDELDPAWSPGRADYAYVTDRSGPLEIWRRSVDEQWNSPLVRPEYFPTPTTAFGSLAFSPDGNSLAYERLGSDGYRLWISALAGGAPHRLAPEEVYQDAPTWSPNGKSVAFVRASSRGWDLVKATLGGSTVDIARDSVVPYSRPQWSPDGRVIAFQSPAGLSLIEPDGKALSVISRDDWLTFAWNPRDGLLYGLRRNDDRVHFSLASLNPADGTTRKIGRDLGLVPIANQPIRGFTWTGRDFATSIARVKSDIWILDGVGRPPSFFDRFWRYSGFFIRPAPVH